MPLPFVPRLGRKPRTFRNIPTRSKMEIALRQKLPPIPPEENYLSGQSQWGAFLNDQLGDCTCAAVYHALQILSRQTSTEIPVADTDVLGLYEAACGYRPGDPSTDNGGIEQTVLQYWKTTGAPLNGSRNKLYGFFEVDPRNTDDIQRSVWECGALYIGFEVPEYLMQDLKSEWDYRPGQEGAGLVGGHAVVVGGYSQSAGTYDLISWGSVFKMSQTFWTEFVDEAYALISTDWVSQTGKTPLGISLDELDLLMGTVTSD